MASTAPADMQNLDVVIVGGGFAGIYAIVKLRQMGLSVRAIEAGSNVGGTWYWNRYPGARCDVPSIEYSYSFDEDLQQEWDWTEVMAAQPEILTYANHVADRFDVRRDIEFDSRVKAARFDEDAQRWQVETDTATFSARFCIMATGCLSVPNTPFIEGQDDFQGPVYHTGRWPTAGVDFTGLRVGLIGTGSSGVQSVPVIAEQAEHLTVFQRTPNYTLPANNIPLPENFGNRVKSHYAEIRDAQRHSQIGVSSFGVGLGGIGGHAEPTESILTTTEDERLAALDEYGFEALRRYNDVQLDAEANELACEMYREQVRRVVDDPETAESLMPRDYPIGCKRPVIDIGYYEAFNRDNVTLIDLRKGGIERITKTGVQTGQGHFEFDVLVYATGFDAMTGALLAMDIRGREGRALKEHWEAGPKTYLGLQMSGFPNLFTVTGPGSPSVLSNMLVSIEQHVDFIADCINYIDQHGLRVMEASEVAEAAWVEHVNEVAEGTMLTAPSCNSWYLGANIPGKPRIFMPYVAGVGEYRRRCEEVARNGYEGFLLS